MGHGFLVDAIEWLVDLFCLLQSLPLSAQFFVSLLNGLFAYRVRFGGERHKPSHVASRSPVGRVPRISRLMGLAIKLDGLVRSGVVRNYSELAVLGNVTKARITQIMNLNLLAPSIQEQLLFWPG